MNRLYNFLIPGWSAARAGNPLLTSLGHRRRARERRMDWALALGLVVWVYICILTQIRLNTYLSAINIGIGYVLLNTYYNLWHLSDFIFDIIGNLFMSVSYTHLTLPTNREV